MAQLHHLFAQYPNLNSIQIDPAKCKPPLAVLPATVTSLTILSTDGFPPRTCWPELRNLKVLSMAVGQPSRNVAKDLWNQNLTSLTSIDLKCYVYNRKDLFPDAICPSLRSLSLDLGGRGPDDACSTFVRRHASQLTQLALHCYAELWLPLVSIAPSFRNLTTLTLETRSTLDIDGIRALLSACPCFAELHIEAGAVELAFVDLVAPYLVSLKCEFSELSAALLASLRRCTKLAHLTPSREPSEAHLPLYLAVGAPLRSLTLRSFDADAADPAMLDSIARTCTNLTDLTICIDETLLNWPIATLRNLTIDGTMEGEAVVNFLHTLFEWYPRLRSLAMTSVENLPSLSALVDALYAAEAGGLERLEFESPAVHAMLHDERYNYMWLDIVLHEAEY